MRKLSFVFAFFAVLALAVSVAPVQAQNKKLWQGWIEELQKIGAPKAAPAPAKPAAPAKKKVDKKKTVKKDDKKKMDDKKK